MPTFPRIDATVREDSAVFALLGHNFDAQYAQLERILDDAHLTGFDGKFTSDMQLKRDECGFFCLENLHSNVLPYDIHVIDRVFWHCTTSAELQPHHEVYQVRSCKLHRKVAETAFIFSDLTLALFSVWTLKQVHEATNDTVWTKIIDTIQLSTAASTTLTIRSALKRYIEEHRVVAVWEAVIEAEGSVSMRLHEKGWSLLRPTRVRPPNQPGPVSSVQSCIRVTPEMQGAYLEQELAVGTLTNMLIGSYRRHMLLMRQIADDLLVTQFERFAM